MRTLLTALLLSLPVHAQVEGDLAPEGRLGYLDGEAWQPLRVDPTSLGLRFAEDLTEADVRAKIAQIELVAPGQAEAAYFQPGVTVYLETREGTTARAALAACAALREDERVLSASPRLYAMEDARYLTEELLVRWRPETSPSQRAALTADLTETAQLAYSVNPGVVYQVPNGVDPLKRSNQLAESGAVLFSVPDFQLYRVPLSAGGGTNDPLFSNQWHLERTGQSGAQVDADIDVSGAWLTTRGSADVIVAVMDSGCELGHPDLASNSVQGIDVLEDDNDPSAESYLFGLLTDNHGTSVAGVAAGIGNNGVGISGVAQECSHMAIRFLSDGNIFLQPTLQDEADSWNFARQNGASVMNCSWGPSGAAPIAGPTRAAIDDANQNGRGGLGMLTLFAAGNSGTNNSGNGYASYSGVVCVSASSDQDLLSSYSSFGPSVDICAPSNGGVNGVWTTDRLGSAGYDSSDYTSSFGGTSSASPCAAGVFLLVLSANPNLTREEAIEIVQDTADKIDQAGGGYDANGHSDFYGFGKVNAQAAVEAAVAAGGGGCESANYCAQSPNSSGASAAILNTGSLSVGDNDFTLEAVSCATSQFGIFYYGPNQLSTSFGDGVRCVGGQTKRLPVVQTDGFGDVSYEVDLSAEGIAAGDVWNFQFWFRDGSSFNLSDGLEVEFCQ